MRSTAGSEIVAVRISVHTPNADSTRSALEYASRNVVRAHSSRQLEQDEILTSRETVDKDDMELDSRANFTQLETERGHAMEAGTGASHVAIEMHST